MSTFKTMSTQELRAFNRLLGPETRPFVEFLEKELTSIHAAILRVPDGDRMRQLQGKGQILSDLLTTIHSAADMLRRAE